MARPEGLEPPTPRFEAWCSIQLSYGRVTLSVPIPDPARATRAGIQRVAPVARQTPLHPARAFRLQRALEDIRHTLWYSTVVKPFRWAPDKNELLKAERGVGFEDVTVAIESGGLLQLVPHPNPAKYPRQKVMVVNVAGYAYLAPFVDDADHYFLKTIIPSRKATRDFLNKETDDV
jgi:hypothetical protein